MTFRTTFWMTLGITFWTKHGTLGAQAEAAVMAAGPSPLHDFIHLVSSGKIECKIKSVMTLKNDQGVFQEQVVFCQLNKCVFDTFN